eukprot:Rhum_TRINITY_DN14753_c0_g2::Rhum_TRINITY_DN14753_c0_g2_i1::g.118402::m.118402
MRRLQARVLRHRLRAAALELLLHRVPLEALPKGDGAHVVVRREQLPVLVRLVHPEVVGLAQRQRRHRVRHHRSLRVLSLLQPPRLLERHQQLQRRRRDHGLHVVAPLHVRRVVLREERHLLVQKLQGAPRHREDDALRTHLRRLRVLSVHEELRRRLEGQLVHRPVLRRRPHLLERYKRVPGGDRPSVRQVLARRHLQHRLEPARHSLVPSVAPEVTEDVRESLRGVPVQRVAVVAAGVRHVRVRLLVRHLQHQVPEPDGVQELPVVRRHAVRHTVRALHQVPHCALDLVPNGGLLVRGKVGDLLHVAHGSPIRELELEVCGGQDPVHLRLQHCLHRVRDLAAVRRRVRDVRLPQLVQRESLPAKVEQRLRVVSHREVHGPERPLGLELLDVAVHQRLLRQVPHPPELRGRAHVRELDGPQAPAHTVTHVVDARLLVRERRRGPLALLRHHQAHARVQARSTRAHDRYVHLLPVRDLCLQVPVLVTHVVPVDLEVRRQSLRQLRPRRARRRRRVEPVQLVVRLPLQHLRDPLTERRDELPGPPGRVQHDVLVVRHRPRKRVQQHLLRRVERERDDAVRCLLPVVGVQPRHVLPHEVRRVADGLRPVALALRRVREEAVLPSGAHARVPGCVPRRRLREPVEHLLVGRLGAVGFVEDVPGLVRHLRPVLDLVVRRRHLPRRDRHLQAPRRQDVPVHVRTPGDHELLRRERQPLAPVLGEHGDPPLHRRRELLHSVVRQQRHVLHLPEHLQQQSLDTVQVHGATVLLKEPAVRRGEVGHVRVRRRDGCAVLVRYVRQLRLVHRRLGSLNTALLRHHVGVPEPQRPLLVEHRVEPVQLRQCVPLLPLLVRHLRHVDHVWNRVLQTHLPAHPRRAAALVVELELLQHQHLALLTLLHHLVCGRKPHGASSHDHDVVYVCHRGYLLFGWVSRAAKR